MSSPGRTIRKELRLSRDGGELTRSGSNCRFRSRRALPSSPPGSPRRCRYVDAGLPTSRFEAAVGRTDVDPAGQRPVRSEPNVVRGASNSRSRGLGHRLAADRGGRPELAVPWLGARVRGAVRDRRPGGRLLRRVDRVSGPLRQAFDERNTREFRTHRSGRG